MSVKNIFQLRKMTYVWSYEDILSRCLIPKSLSIPKWVAMKGNAITAVCAFGPKNWCRKHLSNYTFPETVFGCYNICSKQLRTQQCLNKAPLWCWTKQHVILRPKLSSPGGNTALWSFIHTHTHTNHLSQSNSTTYTIDSSSVWHCGFLSSVLFWHCSWKKAFQRPGEEGKFPVNRGDEKQRTGLYVKQQQHEQTQKERERRSQV